MTRRQLCCITKIKPNFINGTTTKLCKSYKPYTRPPKSCSI